MSNNVVCYFITDTNLDEGKTTKDSDLYTLNVVFYIPRGLLKNKFKIRQKY